MEDLLQQVMEMEHGRLRSHQHLLQEYLEYLVASGTSSVDGVQEDMVASGTSSGNWSCTPVTDGGDGTQVEVLLQRVMQIDLDSRIKRIWRCNRSFRRCMEHVIAVCFYCHLWLYESISNEL